MTLDEQIADDEARARWFVVRRGYGGRIVERFALSGWTYDVYMQGRTRFEIWSMGSATREEAEKKRRLALRRPSTLPRDPTMFVCDPSLVRMLPPGTRARRLERALRDLANACNQSGRPYWEELRTALRLLRAAEKRRQR